MKRKNWSESSLHSALQSDNWSGVLVGVLNSTFQKIDWLTNGLHSKIIFGFGLWIALQTIGVLKYPDMKAALMMEYFLPPLHSKVPMPAYRNGKERRRGRPRGKSNTEKQWRFPRPTLLPLGFDVVLRYFLGRHSHQLGGEWP